MSIPVPLRTDFDAVALRRAAKVTKDAAQGRRLLALAEIYNGGMRTDAARIGGVGLQTIRDWVLAFNQKGPHGLINGKAPGQPSKLNEDQRRALARMVEDGPIPAIHRVVDQAGWHGSAKLIVPANITLLPLPPRSPELNPVENVWQFLRGNWLSNRVFASYDDIVGHCCDAWNKLVDQPWRIMSLGLRDWAHEC